MKNSQNIELDAWNLSDIIDEGDINVHDTKSCKSATKNLLIENKGNVRNINAFWDELKTIKGATKLTTG